jgi:hypothetical protein
MVRSLTVTSLRFAGLPACPVPPVAGLPQDA